MDNSRDCFHIVETLYVGPFKKYIQKRSELYNVSKLQTRWDCIYPYLFTLFEVYRTIASIFLVTLLPNDCTHQDCSIQALYVDRTANAVALGIGLCTFCSFLVLYCTEFLRENMLQSELIIHPVIRSGIPGIHTYQNKHLVKLGFFIAGFFNLDKRLYDSHPLVTNQALTTIQSKLKYYNTLYRTVTYVTIGTYFFNVLASLVAVGLYNANIGSYILVVSNIFLICPKLYSCFSLTHPNGSLELTTKSAYQTDCLEYNDYNSKNKDILARALQNAREEFLAKKAKISSIVVGGPESSAPSVNP